jgi:hypothetical protein
MKLFILALTLGLILILAPTAYAYKVTVWVLNANSDMGKMKVCVNKDCTKINIGKKALYWDDSDFVLKTFKLDHKQKYKACIDSFCELSNKKTVKISVQEVYRNWE